MKRREPVLIYMDILAALFEGPRGPTRLAQACNINYGRLENYTGPLLTKGLLRVGGAEGQEALSITEQGRDLYLEWLEVWKKLPLGVT
ncbi:MAG: transcriptional regulator [Thaumarchaeota archaeon]|nr:transcriptional regulator [Nitrososphaerota archaeon]